MDEALKLVGGVAWVVGFLLFLVSPMLAVLVLLVAAFLSARSVRRTRERRHQELLDR